MTAAQMEQVYAIKFSTGAVKVGRTKDFGRRLAEHAKHAAPHGVTVVDTWDAIVDDSYAAEFELMRSARVFGGVSMPGNPEWFTGLNFDQFVTTARAIYSDTDTQYAQQDFRIPGLLPT